MSKKRRQRARLRKPAEPAGSARARVADGVPSKPKGKRRRKLTTPALAEEWQVTTQTIRNWKRAGAPFGDQLEMVKWLGSKKGLPEQVVRRLDAFRAANPEAFPRQDPDWISYQLVKNDRRSIGGKLPFQSLEEIRDFFAYKLELAAAAGNLRIIEFATEQLVGIDRAMRDSKLAEKKLGLEVGETITRAACEVWIRSWVHWTMRGVDQALADLCPKIAGAVDGSTVDQVRRLVEPWFLEFRLLVPFAKSVNMAAPLAAPAWAVACAKDAVDDYVEDGARQFTAAQEAK